MRVEAHTHMPARHGWLCVFTCECSTGVLSVQAVPPRAGGRAGQPGGTHTLCVVSFEEKWADLK